MNKHITAFLSFILCAATADAASSCVNDTISQTTRPDSVLIIDTDSATQVRIFGREGDKSYRLDFTKGYSKEAVSTIVERGTNWDFSLPFSKEKKKSKASWSVNGFAFVHFGLHVLLDRTGPVSPKIGYNAGFDIINLQYTAPARRDRFYIGFGVEANIIPNKDNQRWIKADGSLTSTLFPEESRKRHSNLLHSSFTFPFRYEHKFFKDLNVGFSVIPQWHLAQVSNKYKIGNRSYTDIYKNLDQRKFSTAFSLSIRHSNWGGVFVTYDPYYVTTGHGAKFKMLTVGFTL